MSTNKYWQSFAELNDNKRFQQQNQDEFREQLPFEDLDKGLLDAKTPRRDFLKYVGFSTAAATIAASCQMPVRKAVPYVNRPENVTPGVAKYYATTFVQDGEVIPAVAKVRDGRPIKLEGNTLSPLTKGGTSPRMQASVLDLYDTFRITHPQRNAGNGKWEEIPKFEQLDSQIASAMAGLGGGAVVLLTSTINSPSTRQLISEFLGRVPGARHVQYDAVSYSGMIQANMAGFGRPKESAIPGYNFDRAAVIVSIGADFLGTWLTPVDFARQYATGRKINEAAPKMNKHYQLESFLSLTGSNADERYVHRPSETGNVVMALANALGVAGTPNNLPNGILRNKIAEIATELKAAGRNALVVCGSNDPNVQTVVNAINSALGAYGNTIDWGSPLVTKAAIDKDMNDLVTAMNAGQVGALLVYDANPAYDYFNAKGFTDGLKKVRLSVSFNAKMDETTALCQYAVPSHHYLESWGDAESRSGNISFIQPTIFPLFKTRPFQTSLLKWSGNNTDWETYFRGYWSGKLGGAAGFDGALQDGVLANGRTVAAPATATSGSFVTDTINTDGTTTTFATPPAGGGQAGSFNGGGVGAAVLALSAAATRPANEVVLYQNVAMGSGKQSANPWLLELPDPITKATWDNFAMISVAKAKELGIELDSDYEYYREKPQIDITVNGVTLTLPVLAIPGVEKDTIAIAVGYGRSEAYGKAAAGTGPNVFPFARFNGNTVDYHNAASKVVISEKGQYKIAQTQVHNSYENRQEVVKETTMAAFLLEPTKFRHQRDELVADYAKKTGDYRHEATLYAKPNEKGGNNYDHGFHGAKWGMAIDMNSCIGCGACVVACHLENNVPVVGKSEVLRAHEMHWLRIDRYFVSEGENADNLKAVVFQPMLCQHCDNAPCENVCPVAATMHSSEGINQMAYNRCIGTRYCANNCPYKVRRFNWADYTGASTHGKLGPESGVGARDFVIEQMNDDLTRMVLNPDVVTRSRGVMEKCTFCVQRTQEGKLKAKLENRPLGGDEVQSACAQACPTNAIVFGNANDPNSTVSQWRKNNPNRLFHVIEQIHTLPNVSYLAKVRNSKEIPVNPENMGGHGRQEDHGGVKEHGEKPAATPVHD
ncbi:TAT-variant-translocated molybdopterin oxidoreductase [Flaviaesturariibacter amylovorans]|uniref:TAT-variant-translocated molybdopterin oxidoreductase n=1 Tax=Flaviaesturariibacter amylovorans TaxID=1084520 RepID=A0ABP8HQW1_9BACT